MIFGPVFIQGQVLGSTSAVECVTLASLRKRKSLFEKSKTGKKKLHVCMPENWEWRLDISRVVRFTHWSVPSHSHWTCARFTLRHENGRTSDEAICLFSRRVTKTCQFASTSQLKQIRKPGFTWKLFFLAITGSASFQVYLISGFL